MIVTYKEKRRKKFKWREERGLGWRQVPFVAHDVGNRIAIWNAFHRNHHSSVVIIRRCAYRWWPDGCWSLCSSKNKFPHLYDLNFVIEPCDCRLLLVDFSVRMSDPRFARLKTDPRFRPSRKKHQKVVIDERFKSIFDQAKKGRDNAKREQLSPVHSQHASLTNS